MFEQTKKFANVADIFVLCAAVADFTIEEPSSIKVKRGKEDLSLNLKPTNDIASWVGSNKKENSIAVGFALENHNELENALSKLERKNLDMIVLNSMNDKGAGFSCGTNKVTIINKNKDVISYPLKCKKEVAKDIVDNIEKIL